MNTRRSAATFIVTMLVLAACRGTDPTVEAPNGADASAPTPAPSAEPLPDLEVDDFAGEPVSLAAYTGTPLVVNFWASWCPPCIAEMPDIESVHQLSDGRVTFVGINTQDTEDQAAQLVEQTGVTYDLVRDPDAELFQAFGVFAMPTTFYVDATGDIVGRHAGLLTRDTLLDDLVQHLGVDVTADP